MPLKLTGHFYVIIFFVSLGFPWWAIDSMSSGIILLHSNLLYLLPLPPQWSPFSYKYYDRTQFQRYCRNEKYKPKCSRICQSTREHKKCKPQLDGWASWPDTAPNLSSHLQITMPILDEFVSTHDPSCIMEFAQFFSEPSHVHGVVTVPLQHQVLISRFEDPCCFSSKLIASSLIIDSGTSVCLSPHKSDFITYNKSKMKIKDLSSSNHVAGEDIIRWSMHDALGTPIQIEPLGYHLPKADVRLLSPQVLITTTGGQSLQTDKGIDISLNNKINLFAQYCPQSNLPLIPLALHTESSNCFWNTAFGFTADNFKEINAIKSTLLPFNTNLFHSQK
jgi:hypothetical protein